MHVPASCFGCTGLLDFFGRCDLAVHVGGLPTLSVLMQIEMVPPKKIVRQFTSRVIRSLLHRPLFPPPNVVCLLRK
jgi:hypothetical protein